MPDPRPAAILIIDDDPLFTRGLERPLRMLGHEPRAAHTLASGLELAQSQSFDVALLDVRLPDGDGLDALIELNRSPGEPEVIIVTGEGDPDGAGLAVSRGAWDYLEKPLSLDQLCLSLKRALEYRKSKRGARPSGIDRQGALGSSPAWLDCLERAAEAAAGDAPVLIMGETGAGKELLARVIHHNSPRAARPLVALDCGAVAAELLANELFGHAKGAYTGASSPTAGLIKSADGGTLFLDEAAELPLDLQSSLLRVLETKRFRPLGADAEAYSDFRVIAATNADPRALAREGAFRADLLYRLAAATIHVPPLRERGRDVVELALGLTEAICAARGLPAKGHSPDYLETLMEHDWPGNVRELRNAVERAVAACGRGEILFARHLPPDLRAVVASARMGGRMEMAAPRPALPAISGLAPSAAYCPGTPDKDRDRGRDGDRDAGIESWKDYRLRAEREYVRAIMRLADNSPSRAARLAKVSRQQWHNLLKKHACDS